MTIPSDLDLIRNELGLQYEMISDKEIAGSFARIDAEIARLTAALRDETFKATEYERLFAEASAALERERKARKAVESVNAEEVLRQRTNLEAQIESLTAALEATEQELNEADTNAGKQFQRAEAAERDREHIFKDLENVGKKLEAAEQERDALNEEWMAAEARHTESRQAAEQRVAKLEASLDETAEYAVKQQQRVAELEEEQHRMSVVNSELLNDIAKLQAVLREIELWPFDVNSDAHIDLRDVKEVARAALGEGEK